MPVEQTHQGAAFLVFAVFMCICFYTWWVVRRAPDSIYVEEQKNEEE